MNTPVLLVVYSASFFKPTLTDKQIYETATKQYPVSMRLKEDGTQVDMNEANRKKRIAGLEKSRKRTLQAMEFYTKLVNQADDCRRRNNGNGLTILCPMPFRNGNATNSSKPAVARYNDHEIVTNLIQDVGEYIRTGSIRRISRRAEANRTTALLKWKKVRRAVKGTIFSRLQKKRK